MSKKILFEELVARREQREADKLKVGVLRIPGTDQTLEARMPSKKVVLELYGELSSISDPTSALKCSDHAIYAVCPQLQDRKLQQEIGTSDDPMSTIDALFTIVERDKLGEQAFQFVGLLPSTPAAENDEQQGDTALETVKN